MLTLHDSSVLNDTERQRSCFVRKQEQDWERGEVREEGRCAQLRGGCEVSKGVQPRGKGSGGVVSRSASCRACRSAVSRS